MAEPAPRPAFIPSIVYKDNRAALKWLENAFGFEPSEVLVDSNDNIVHAEMSHGAGVIMVGNEFAGWAKSPLSVGGANTQRIHVQIDSGIDAHFDRARKAGAKVVMEPKDQFYGVRSYTVQDHERPPLDFLANREARNRSRLQQSRLQDQAIEIGGSHGRERQCRYSG